MTAEMKEVQSYSDHGGGPTVDGSSNPVTPWRLAKERAPRWPTWTENGTEFMIVNHIEHMPYEYVGNNVFYGPKSEWKENINEEYIYKPKAFVALTEGEEPSLEGHYNSKNESLYPKLIESWNNSEKYKNLELKDISNDFKNVTIIKGEDGQIYGAPLDDPTIREPIRFFLYGAIGTILLLFFMHKNEGTTLKSFKVNRGVIHMKSIGMGDMTAKRYYDNLIEKGLY